MFFLLIGIPLVSCKQQNTTDYVNGLKIIRDGKFKGLVNINGLSILETKYEHIEVLDSNFIQACSSYSKNKKSCGVFDSSGKEIIPIVTSGILEIYDSKYFLVALGKSKAIFDLNGNLVLDKQDEIYSYNKGVVLFTNRMVVGDLEVEKRYFARDLNNPKSKLNMQNGFKRHVELLNPQDERTDFLFRTSDNFIFNINGMQVKRFSNYYKVKNYGEGYLIVENKDFRKGYANKRGELIFKQVFLTAKPFKNGKAKVSIGANQDFTINKKGICIENCLSESFLKYHNISNWVN